MYQNASCKVAFLRKETAEYNRSLLLKQLVVRPLEYPTLHKKTTFLTCHWCLQIPILPPLMNQCIIYVLEICYMIDNIGVLLLLVWRKECMLEGERFGGQNEAKPAAWQVIEPHEANVDATVVHL